MANGAVCSKEELLVAAGAQVHVLQSQLYEGKINYLLTLTSCPVIAQGLNRRVLACTSAGKHVAHAATLQNVLNHQKQASMRVTGD